MQFTQVWGFELPFLWLQHELAAPPCWQDSAETIPWYPAPRIPAHSRRVRGFQFISMCSSPVAYIPMETTRSFPSVRTAATSLPAADKPICHEVIKRHVLCLQELAPGFVPPKPEAAHPPRRQTMAIVVPRRAGMGTHRGALRVPKMPELGQ